MMRFVLGRTPVMRPKLVSVCSARVVVEHGARVDVLILSRVEGVVELGAELQRAGSDREVLEERHVVVDVPGRVVLVVGRATQIVRIVRAAAGLDALGA